MKRKLSIVVACSHRDLTGESPVWSVRDQALYWVDIRGHLLHRLTAGGVASSWPMGRRIGAVGFRAGGGLIVTMDDGIYAADPDPRSETVAMTLLVKSPLPPEVRLKEGRVDPFGRYWCGSTGASRQQRDGALFRLESRGPLKTLDRGFILVNGLAFSSDKMSMMMSDSPDDTVYAYDLDADSSISNRRVFFSTAKFPGAIDGATFDADGGYWGAMVGDWSVVRFNRDGHLDQLIRIPTRYSTMCAFGGPNLDILYVTSSMHHLNEEEQKAQPQGGMLFAIHGLGIAGVPEPEFKD